MARRTLFFVTPGYGRGGGGVAVSAERIVRSLCLHFELVVLAPEKELVPGTFTTSTQPGITVVRFNGGADPAQGLQFLADVLERLSQAHRAEAVLSMYAGELAYAAALAAAYLGLRSYVLVRGNDIDLDIFAERAFRIHYALSRAATVFCVSRESARKVQAFAPEAVTAYIPNGIDETEFPFQEAYHPKSPLTVGLFGEIKAKKGLDFLLAALDLKRFSLQVTGTLRPEIEKLLHAHFALHPETLDSFKHIPFIKDTEELVAAYYSTDIVCIPSVHDGMPNVLLEALSCGKIVVASAVGGAPDVIRHGKNGFLFTPRDVASFREAMAAAEAALAVPEIRRSARRTVESDFSWRHERARYLRALGAGSAVSAEDLLIEPVKTGAVLVPCPVRSE